MSSPAFQSYERNLRKIFWQQLVDRELELARMTKFKASIVVNSRDAMMGPQLGRSSRPLSGTRQAASFAG